MAASTITVTHAKLPNRVRVITFTCTASSVDASFLNNVSNKRDIEGYVFLVTTNPGATGPTDGTDIVLDDIEGIDIMGGQMTDVNGTSSEQFVPLINNVFGSRYVRRVITPKITNNAVNSAVIVISVYYYI